MSQRRSQFRAATMGPGDQATELDAAREANMRKRRLAYWPSGLDGKPLTEIIRTDRNPDGLPECQICGVITSFNGFHDPECGGKARALLASTMAALAAERETQGKDVQPRPPTTLSLLRDLPPEERRLEVTPSVRKAMVAVLLKNTCMIPDCGCDGRRH